MPTYRRIVAIVLAAYLLLVLVDRFVLVNLFAMRCGVAILLAAVEALACFGAGWLLLRRRDLPLAFLAGYPLFGTLCFLVGCVRVASWTMLPLVAIMALAGAYALLRGARITHEPLARDAFGLAALALLLALGVIAAQAPPTSLDELAYHLAVPHAWVLEGRVIELPLLSHSYFPLGIESADLPLLATLGTDGAIASHFLHLIAAIAATLLVLRRTKSMLVTAAIAATPALANTIGWSLVDWPLLGISVALIAAVEDDDQPALTAALAAGLLTKYTFLPIALVALAVGRRWSWRAWAPGLAIGSVFFLRNLILTGNPIAPFLGAMSPHVASYRGAPMLSSYVFDGFFVDEALGASLLILCTLAAGRMAWSLFGAGALLWLLAPSARLLVPFFALAAISAAPELWDRRPRRSRAFAILLSIAIVLQLAIVAWFTYRNEPFSLLAGTTSDEQYLTKQRPSYAAISWLNGALPPDSRTLVVGLNETFWFERRVRGGGNFDGNRLSAYLDLPTPEAVHTRLRADGITHVAVIADAAPSTQVATKLEERETNLSPAARRMLAMTLDRYASNVTARNNATLFTLR